MTHRAKLTMKQRKAMIKAIKITRGQRTWRHEDSMMNEVIEEGKVVLRNN